MNSISTQISARNGKPQIQVKPFESVACQVRLRCLLFWHDVEYTRTGIKCQRCKACEYTPEFERAGYLMRPVWAVLRFFDDLIRKDDGLPF